MAKSVLETISGYACEPSAAERLATADLELELSDRMVDLRERAGYTQKELASRVRCTQAYVAKLERGAYDRCGIGVLRTFARAMGHDIDIDQFLVPSSVMSRRYRYLEACSDYSDALRGYLAANQQETEEVHELKEPRIPDLAA